MMKKRVDDPENQDYSDMRREEKDDHVRISTWTFFVTQVGIVFTVVIAIFASMNWCIEKADQRYYSKTEGDQDKKIIETLRVTIEKLNDTLVDLQIFLSQKGYVKKNIVIPYERQ